MHSFRIAFAGLWLVLLASICAAAEPNFPTLDGAVVDASGFLNASERQSLEQKLRDYQASSGRQVVVAVLPSLAGYDIRDYGVRLFRHWQLGDKTRNDGVLLLVAPNERKVSIEVGYGAEGDLTDAMSRIIIENAMIPRFKAGDWAGGIDAGVDDIAQTLGGGGNVVAERARNTSSEMPIEDLLPLIIFFLIVMFIIFNASRGGRRNRVIILPMPGGWSGGGGSGGGYSGGGGSSGGGGASGGW